MSPGRSFYRRPSTSNCRCNGREVTEGDLQRIVAQGQSMAAEDAHGHPLELIHTIPVHYALDQQKGIRDPVGMTGDMLQAQLHLVSAAFGPVRTLRYRRSRAAISISTNWSRRLTPAASPALSKMKWISAAWSSIWAQALPASAVFFDGSVVYADGIPVGGAHVTNDIARGLTTSVVHAERLKTLYGNAIPGAMDEREIIDVPQVGEEAPENANHVPKSHLIRIIQPRLEEIFELVRARMDKSGFGSRRAARGADGWRQPAAGRARACATRAG